MARVRRGDQTKPEYDAKSLVLATARYQDKPLIVASGLAPIRTTRGAPRFKLGYELGGSVMELAPPTWMLKMEGEAFIAAYRRHLDEVGVAAIASSLGRTIASSGKRGAVLLCFEDVTKGQLCHRRVFAEWWQERVGAEVPELSASVLADG
jgi:hypothetical protein